jgi:hypothetical protein
MVSVLNEGTTAKSFSQILELSNLSVRISDAPDGFASFTHNQER